MKGVGVMERRRYRGASSASGGFLDRSLGIAAAAKKFNPSK